MLDGQGVLDHYRTEWSCLYLQSHDERAGFPPESLTGGDSGAEEPVYVDLRGRLAGTEVWDQRELSEVQYLVIHHSGTPTDSPPAQIAGYHVYTNKWPGIGYHWVVSQTGVISLVGDMRTVRANVKYRNREVVGICLPGDWTAQTPPLAQLQATKKLVRWLRAGYGWELVGHKDIADPRSPTACPGAFSLWRGWLV